jgi:hypothetical protein
MTHPLLPYPDSSRDKEGGHLKENAGSEKVLPCDALFAS